MSPVEVNSMPLAPDALLAPSILISPPAVLIGSSMATPDKLPVSERPYILTSPPFVLIAPSTLTSPCPVVVLPKLPIKTTSNLPLVELIEPVLFILTLFPACKLNCPSATPETLVITEFTVISPAAVMFCVPAPILFV